jgi:cytokinin dehydrogenase
LGAGRQGPVLLYPANRLRVLTPLFRLPDTPNFYLLGILRSAIPASPARINELIQANRRLFEQCAAIGGKRYPVDSVPMDRQDWQRHYELLWGLVAASKRYFDPDNILGPGHGIFN